MAKRKPEEWITSKEAADILTANSGHEVSDNYVRLLAAKGKIGTKQIDARTKLYRRADVETIVVDTKRGPKPKQEATS